MAKKKAQKKKRPEGYDPNEIRRQRLEERRLERERALKQQQRDERRERLVRYILIAGLLTAVIWFLFFRAKLPGEIAGHTVRDLSAAGANIHEDGTLQYETDPPASGAHDLTPSPCGIHNTPIPNENFVHTLEHGAVAVVYQPTLAPADIKRIETIVGSFESHTLSAPNSTMDAQIAVVAWGRLMELEELDEPAIREFIGVFRQGGEAPEASNRCPNDADQSFSPETPTPAPTGEPKPSPTEDAGKGDKGDKKG